MTGIGSQPTVDGAGGLTLAFDTSADAVVGEHRPERETALSVRERLAVAVVGLGFAATATALIVVLPAGSPPGLAIVLLYVAVYAFVSRVEFEVFTGSALPTQLVLVPMLVVLPLRLVPLAVAGGLAVGSLVDSAAMRVSVERAALVLVSSWHSVGPVVVLVLAGDQAPSWSRWPIYVAALGAQFLCETSSVLVYEGIARGTRPRVILPHLWRVQLVDGMLAPVGLVFAFVASDQPLAVLLVLPLVGLLRVFARERRARIDNAIELSTAYRGTAFLLGDVVEADDSYTGLHSRDVVELAVAVAEELDLAPDVRRDTEFVALLHDVGKIRVPSEIINKAGPLTPDERAVMEAHTIEGERLLDQVGGLLGQIGRIVRSCHERWDGRGYPDGLHGEEIPLVARIVMCCDAFSAMTTDRSYRKALPLTDALVELRANAGSQFDPLVVDALLEVIERGALARPAA